MTLVHRPTYVCDGCGRYIAEKWRALRFQYGWRMKVTGNTTAQHFCPTCIERGLNR
jgi:hypothetical protein